MGEPPPWWRLLAAARWLGVAPWDLARQPSWWVDIACEAAEAEAHAQKVHNDRRGR